LLAKNRGFAAKFKQGRRGVSALPYKDPEAKRAWELRHRAERLARRRELRRIQAAKEAQPPLWADNIGGIYVLFLPLLAGAGLAAYSPKLALGAGGLTLLAATNYRKGWPWWLVGALTILLALLFLKWDKGPQLERKNDL
jgi:hypothetical protein